MDGAASIDPRLRTDPETADARGKASHGNGTAGASLTPVSPLAPGGVSGATYTHTGHSRSQSQSQSHPPSTAHILSPTSATATATPTSPTGADADDAHDDSALGGPGGAADPKKPRACEACRGLKVRCDPDPANPEGACKRCAKAGRACVVTQPTRKRQKKTDSRVAELEKKIDALTQTLHASRGPAAPGIPARDEGVGSHEYAGGFAGARHAVGREWAGAPGREGRAAQGQNPYEGERASAAPVQQYPPPMVMAGQKRKFTETREAVDREESGARETPAVAAAAASLGREYSDIVDRGVVTMSKAVELFRRYTDRMCHHLPAVIFPEGTTAAEVRKSKPILFLAVMAAASSEMPTVQRTMVKEMLQILAEKIVVVGEKNLELVQALHLSVIWYWPPEHFEELKFYQLVHMAAVMAIDIGLGRRKPGRNRRHIPYTWRDHPFKKHPLPDPCSIESRRAWLTCYFLTTNTAMAMHRPNLLRWNSFMTECMEVLESSSEAAPSDKYLCHLVWTHRMAEDVGEQFAMDDPMTTVNITDQRTQFALRGFERDLEKYRSALPKEMLQPSLRLSFQVVSLYMHEIALQTENSETGEFGRPPFTADSMKEVLISDATLTQAHINALSACLTAIDGIFDAFLGMEVAAIRCLPVFNFVRVAYATVVLIKLYFAASSPNSELGKVINKDNMKVETHLEALLDKFRATAADDKSRPAAKFLVVLVMIRSWFQKQGQQMQNPSKTAPATGRTRDGLLSSECPSVSDTYLASGKPPAPPHPHPSYAVASTPLHLLSEIATNDARQPPTFPPPAATAALSTAVSWYHGAQPSQPFMYDASSAGANPPAPATTAAASASDQHTPNTLGGPPTPNNNNNTAAAAQPAAADTAYLNAGAGGLGPQLWGDTFDYAQMGDGFAQAMDLTLAGFTEGGYSVADGMRYMMGGEPWFDGMGGGAFQF